MVSTFFKPNKLSSGRIYWNAFHHLFGYSTIVLAVINNFRGFDLLVVRTQALNPKFPWWDSGLHSALITAHMTPYTDRPHGETGMGMGMGYSL